MTDDTLDPHSDSAGIAGTEADPLVEARVLAEGAAEAGIPLRLIGGLAVRVLCPDFPPRVRADQDIDFACIGKERKAVADELGAEAGRLAARTGDLPMMLHTRFSLVLNVKTGGCATDALPPAGSRTRRRGARMRLCEFIAV